MSSTFRILYCHCAYAQVVPKAVKEEVLRKLGESGAAFDAVPDLCEMSARRDPALNQLARSADGGSGNGGGGVKIAACFPRAVKWLFSAAGAPLPEQGVEVLNMRVEPAEKVVFAVLGDGFKSNGSAEPGRPGEPKETT